jgi:hypothetical protein
LLGGALAATGQHEEKKRSRGGIQSRVLAASRKRLVR